MSLWGNSEKKSLFLGLKPHFGGRNRPDREKITVPGNGNVVLS